MNKQISYKVVSVVFGVLVICFAIAFYAIGWTEPFSNPPGNNVPAPITTKGNQIKDGGLQVSAFRNIGPTLLDDGTPGNTVSDGLKLDVEGKVGATEYCDENGNNCKIATEIGGGGGIPSGAVMTFNLVACPSGWSELVAARGRYMVGLPSGGTLAATVGTALTNTENRPVGQHTHGVNDPGHLHTLGGVTGLGIPPYWLGNQGPVNGVTVWQTQKAWTNITIGNTGIVVGTNAPYIQLLVCQKD
jgi:hypothetical protein